MNSHGASHSLTLDRSLRIVSGDPQAVDLARRAAGQGDVLTLPALAGIAELALQLDVPVDRQAIVADGPHTRLLWVRATPYDDHVVLDVSGWDRLIEPVAHDPARDGDLERLAIDWLWETDEALLLTMISGDVLALFGQPPEMLAGKPLVSLLELDKDRDGKLPLLAAYASRDAFIKQTATIRRGPGAGQRFQLDGMVLHTADGQFGGFRGTAIAVTEEMDLQFADAPSGRTRQFERRLDGAFVRPLDEIVSTAQDIQNQAFGPIRRDYAGYAEGIAGAGQHLRGLLDGLLDTMPINGAEVATLIDLAAIGDRALEMVSADADAKNIAIGWEARPSRLAAIGDARRVLQIVLNLVGNAVKYTPEGGHVALSGSEDNRTVQLTVADSGPGIDGAGSASVFERFERLGRNNAGSDKGAGLGLYIARTLARDMSGDISLESAPGDGARFTLELPAA